MPTAAIELTAQQRALEILRQRGGMIRRAEAPRAGIHPRTLYALRDQGLVESVTRGIYRLTSAPPLGNPDLVTVALRYPKAVICLISALDFHNLTTQIPHAVYIALPRGTELPRIHIPPVRTFWYGDAAYQAGIETHELDGVPVRVYCREKTIADCFRHRNQVGTEVLVEAIQDYLRQRPIDIGALHRYASICRVEKLMRPYLEALL